MRLGEFLGRKLGKDGGRAAMAYFSEVTSFIKAHAGDEAMQPYVKPLETALGDLQKGTMWFMQNAMKAPDNAGAGSYDYMHLFGLVQLGYMWAQIAKAALEKPAILLKLSSARSLSSCWRLAEE